MPKRWIGPLLAIAVAIALTPAAAAGAGVSGAVPYATLPAGSNLFVFGTTLGNRGLLTVGGRLFFDVTGPPDGDQLWVTDGTAAGTSKVADRLVGLGSLAALGDKIAYVAAAPSATYTPQLWVSDGTPGGTQLVYTFPPGASGRPLTFWLAASAGGLAYFTVGTRTGTTSSFLLYSMQLWRTDGTAGGTIPLTEPLPITDPHPGPPGLEADAVYSIDTPTPVVSGIIFTVRPTVFGKEIWRSDGTPAGTYKLLEGAEVYEPLLGPSPDGRYIGRYYGSSFSLSFDAAATDVRRVADPASPADFAPIARSGGLTLFQSGSQFMSAEGAGAARRAFALRADWSLSAVPVAGDLALIVRQPGERPPLCLWRSDGTLAGSAPYWCTPGSQLSYAEVRSPLSGGLLLWDRSEEGLETLWYSDGTARGTRRAVTRVTAFDRDDSGSSTDLGVLGDSYLFARRDRSGIVTLWRFGAEPSGFVRLPAQADGAPGGEAGLPVTYGTNGAGVSGGTLTLTLPAGATYLGDDSGLTPSVAGQQVTWQVPALGRFASRTVAVRVGLPAGALGTRLPVAAAFATAEPSVDASQASAQGEIALAHLVSLPLAPAASPLTP